MTSHLFLQRSKVQWPQRVSLWRGFVRGLAALAAGLVLTACTADAVGGSTPPSKSGPDGAEATTGDEAVDSGAPAGPGADGGVGNGGTGAPSPGAIAELPAPAMGAVRADDDPSADEVLAAMPGLYGLTRLHAALIGDRIELRAADDCAATLEVLQAGQWALEVITGPGSAADETDGGAVYVAELRLGSRVSTVRLIESAVSCTGSVSVPRA